MSLGEDIARHIAEYEDYNKNMKESADLAYKLQKDRKELGSSEKFRDYWSNRHSDKLTESQKDTKDLLGYYNNTIRNMRKSVKYNADEAKKHLRMAQGLLIRPVPDAMSARFIPK